MALVCAALQYPAAKAIHMVMYQAKQITRKQTQGGENSMASGSITQHIRWKPSRSSATPESSHLFEFPIITFDNLIEPLRHSILIR
jgi:hypothetical protein